MGSRADNFVLGKPPADAFGVALRAARQWGIEGVAFAQSLAITLSGPKQGFGRRRTSRRCSQRVTKVAGRLVHAQTYNA